MADEKLNVSETELLNILEKQGEVVATYKKLNSKEVDVEVPKRLSEIRELEAALKIVNESQLSEDKKNEERTKVEQQLVDARSDTLRVKLVPLSAMEKIMVQGYVAEAAAESRNVSFELDVRLFMLMKAEHCSLLYYATRKFENPGERYFEKIEDVPDLDDMVMRQLAQIYKESFVLTSDERKNS